VGFFISISLSYRVGELFTNIYEFLFIISTYFVLQCFSCLLKLMLWPHVINN
jgi:hypothetical protein